METPYTLWGVTPLLYAMAAGSNTADILETVNVLLAAKASVHARANQGLTCPAVLLSNVSTMPKVLRLLIGKGVDLNMRFFPRTRFFKIMCPLSRFAVWCGSQNTVMHSHAGIEAATPLFLAVLQGDADSISELLQAKADPHLRNKQGFTALEFGSSRIYGVAPPLLKNLLTG